MLGRYEYYHKRGGKADKPGQDSDRFRLECRHGLSPESLGVRPGAIIVAVHETQRLGQLEALLADHDPAQSDVVAVAVSDKPSTEGLSDEDAGKRIVAEYETRVFTRAVAVAEKVGKPISLLGLPGRDRYQVLVEAAGLLRSTRLVLDSSTKESIGEQEAEVRKAWNGQDRPGRTLEVQIMARDAEPTCFTLGT